MAKKHKAANSDHISGIAKDEGFALWQSIWMEEGNADLRSKRSNPNLLFKGDRKAPGDVITVPDRKTKKKPVATDGAHKFKLPGVKPLFLRLRILNASFGPIKNADYELKIDGVAEPRKGKTDGSGQIEEEIPPEARKAKLSVRVPPDSTDEPSSSPPATGSTGAASKPDPDLEGDLPISWDLQLGALNPIMEAAPDAQCISGVQARLNNLGLNSGPVDGLLGENTKAAIKAFQKTYGLPESGLPDQGKTQPKLKSVHDDPDSLVPPPPPPAPGTGA